MQQRSIPIFNPLTPGGFPPIANRQIPQYQNLEVRFSGSAQVLATDYVLPPYPQVLELLPILEGEVAWSESFEGEPSGQLTFKTWWENRYEIVSLLRVGTAIEFFGIGFRVSGLEFIEIPTQKNAKPIIVVSVGLGFAHNWVNDSIPLIVNDFYRAQQGEPCEPTASKKESRQKSKYISLGQLAARAGGSYWGPAGKITVPSDAAPESETTFISELDSRLRQEGCFKVLSDPYAIAARTWNETKTWRMGAEDLLSEVSRQFNGELRLPLLLQDKPFHLPPLGNVLPAAISPFLLPPTTREDLSRYAHAEHYFPKCEISGLFAEDSREESARSGEASRISRFYLNSDESNQITNAGLGAGGWRMRTRKIEIVESDPTASNPPSVGAVKTTSINFYESGSNYVKTNEILKTIDGMPLEKRTLKYGFFGLQAVHLYNANSQSIVGISPLAFWGCIEDTVEKVEYDSEGWRLRSITTGWRTIVHQTENVTDVVLDSDPTQDFASLKFRAAAGDTPQDTALKQASLACYQPRKISVYRIEESILSPYNVYYGDVELPDFELEEICDFWGNKTYRSIDNISGGKWTDPRFIRKQQIASVAFSEIDDPRNIQIRINNATAAPAEKIPEFPPLQAGTEEISQFEVKVTSVKNPKWYGSVNLPPGETMADFNKSRNTVDEDRFITTERVATAGGQNFNSQLAEAKTTPNEGRPSGAPQLPPLWEKIPDRDNKDVDPAEQDSERGRRKYYIETSHLPRKGSKQFRGQLTGQTLSYPHAKKASEAYMAAETEYKIVDCQSAVREKATFRFNSNIRSGDRVLYNCNNELRFRRVLAVSWRVKIEGIVGGKPYLRSPGMELDLGAELPVEFLRSSELAPPPKNSNSPQNLGRFALRDLNDIGSITQIGQQSRIK